MNYFYEQHGKNLCDAFFGLTSNYLKFKKLSESIRTFIELMRSFATSFHVQRKDGSPCKCIFVEYSRLLGLAAATMYNITDSNSFLHFESISDSLLGSFDSLLNSSRILIRKVPQSSWEDVEVKFAPINKIIKTEGQIFGKQGCSSIVLK
ncbi:MAG: hypothetical protein EZS28_018868 [Streblomastix strix]|uniref:Uncharacterized protein n=1 Tax=Streblomastix strix TaxID=222440 RepID=A0A5J4VSX3_9EUKA|nr:MAG: hypothetical protein EZS28_018868 [Streblomastix strix]